MPCYPYRHRSVKLLLFSPHIHTTMHWLLLLSTCIFASPSNRCNLCKSNCFVFRDSYGSIRLQGQCPAFYTDPGKHNQQEVRNSWRVADLNWRTNSALFIVHQSYPEPDKHLPGKWDSLGSSLHSTAPPVHNPQIMGLIANTHSSFPALLLG